jgi:hypothetical protein
MRFSALAKRARIASEAKIARGCRDPSRAARGLARGSQALREARFHFVRAVEVETGGIRVNGSLGFTDGKMGSVSVISFSGRLSHD